MYVIDFIYIKDLDRKVIFDTYLLHTSNNFYYLIVHSFIYSINNYLFLRTTSKTRRLVYFWLEDFKQWFLNFYV